MKLLVVKNLIVHRERNQLTAIIQTLTLSTIIFVVTMLNLELKLFDTAGDMANIDFYVRNKKNFDLVKIENIL